jgi:hypothetical protein
MWFLFFFKCLKTKYWGQYPEQREMKEVCDITQHGISCVIWRVLTMMYNIQNHCTLSIVRSSKNLENMAFWSSGEGRETPTLLGLLERANLNHWSRMETDPVSETFFLVFRISDDGQSPEFQWFWSSRIVWIVVTRGWDKRDRQLEW